MTIQFLHRTIGLLRCAFLLLLPALPASGQDLTLTAGATLYTQHCSRCHGVQGGGGEGPALNRQQLPRASNDTAFAEVILNGLPGTGMPGNWALSSSEVREIIRYVRKFSATEKEEIIGNVSHGEVLFLNAGCINCHVIGERGKSIGPDLAGIGLRRGASYLKEILMNPGKQKVVDENGFILYLVVDITLQNGSTISGIRVNEDTFTIQVKDEQLKFHSIQKSGVKTIKRRKEASLMPSFTDTLTAEEMDDIIAFLMNQK